MAISYSCCTDVWSSGSIRVHYLYAGIDNPNLISEICKAEILNNRDWINSVSCTKNNQISITGEIVDIPEGVFIPEILRGIYLDGQFLGDCINKESETLCEFFAWRDRKEAANE